jgi:hypothetical protein
LPEKFDGYLDTNSEESDSDLSGREVDSDIEHEKEITYDRKIYKDDLVTLKPAIKKEIKEAQAQVVKSSDFSPFFAPKQFCLLTGNSHNVQNIF